MRVSFLIILLCSFTTMLSQVKSSNSEKFHRHYYLKKSVYESLPNSDDEIIFLGNSITAGGLWSEMFNDIRIKNRGISGDVTEGILFRIGEVTESHPSKIFLMIGVNDLSKEITVDSVFVNYEKILDYILLQSPHTKIYVQSILPVNDKFNYFKNHTNKGGSIVLLNDKIEKLAIIKGQVFIDLFKYFSNKEGKLKEEYTFDGLHLNGEGYKLWKSCLQKYIK